MTWILLLAALVPQRDSYEKLAPYGAIRWKDGAPEVDVQGTWVALVSIDGVKSADLVAFCRKTWGDRWQKRFEEDLVEALGRMGHKTGATVKLEVKALDTGEARTLESVPMTKENRRKIWEAASKRTAEERNPVLDRAACEADLDELRSALEARYAYLKLKKVDLAAALGALKNRLGPGLRRDDFALEITRFLALFGDGHTRLVEDPYPRLYLPFLVGDSGGRLVAFDPDRSGFIDAERPYLKNIDGRPVEDWLKAAEALVPAGSPHFVRAQSIRMLRHLPTLRAILGVPAEPTLRIEVEAPDGGAKALRQFLLPIKPVYGEWPRGSHRLLDGNLGYLRLAQMDNDPAFLRELAEAMDRFRDTQGLVIDVRGNGGGSRAALETLFPYFMAPGDFRIANVAAPRGNEDLSDRDLHRLDSPRWSRDERAALERFAAGFKPEWPLPEGEFGAWHYYALRPKEALPRYEKPVVVLMNSECFSATDIFLGAFKGWKNVTLLGTPSGGGSGRARLVQLPKSGFRVQMSSMASFRPDGALYDGRGIEPDVVVHPKPADFIEGADSILKAAVEWLPK